MNILTDVLSLIKRSVFAKKAGLDDVLILGTNEKPDMEGIASPVPYKSVKVIKVRDFKVAAEHCAHANSPATPAAGTGQVYQKTESDDVEETCTVYYRSLKSLSSNLTLANSSDDDYVEIDTTGEPNTAENIGTGVGVWKDKVGESLRFKTLRAGTNITYEETANEIIINSTDDRPYKSYVALLTQAGGGDPVPTVLENTTGLTLAWSRLTTGIYKADWDTALPDTDGLFINPSQGNLKNQTVIVNVFGSSVSGFQLSTFNQGLAALNDDELVNTGIEIRIY